MTTAELQRTPLHAAHLTAGAKMVDFGGWHMPVQYAGILAEHAAVRTAAGMFDASHMGEADFIGPGARIVVDRLITNDIDKLSDNGALYTVMCNEDGGIVDDCIVYRFSGEHYRIVINASNIEKDLAHFRSNLRPTDECELVDLSEATALIAVQGPEARAHCAALAGDSILEVPGFGLGEFKMLGHTVCAARTGYTGEDGFELFVAAEHAAEIWEALRERGVQPCGLGARDTLRLEARLCLYGNDITLETTPFEAGLGWVVKLDHEREFIGRERIAALKAEGPSRKLVGFRVEGRGIARAGAEFVDEAGESIGTVRSGGVAPTVGGSVGMGYLPKELATPGAKVTIRQRGRDIAAELVRGPFYKRPA